MGCSSSRGEERKENADSSVAPPHPSPAPAPSSPRSERTHSSVHNKYDFVRKIGAGASSLVLEAVNRKTGERRAVKVVRKSTLDRDELVSLRREIHNLHKVNHPHIVRLIDVFETGDEVYLVTELVEGGELFEQVIKRGRYTEKEAARILVQIISAVDYLHSQGIAHRDLKLENILTTGQSETEFVKIADFGLSKNFADEKLTTCVGSAGYVAPEILLGGGQYDKSVDIWSVGVILYILLSGFPPFHADNETGMLKKIQNIEYNFDQPVWSLVSVEAKDLIRALLTKDPRSRLTAAQIQEHPWLKKLLKSTTTTTE
eukprot:TRINITY_DN6616_c0_g1_i1.p1 TRINITY_DN6616_c0_g1~~TRINITY_DN6616_c0_g1_i1.p1  ORF type:complete len:316 (-),score=54.94 TRINITY_DN6616_c0_g1_i1:206-1153(-)